MCADDHPNFPASGRAAVNVGTMIGGPITTPQQSGR